MSSYAQIANVHASLSASDKWQVAMWLYQDCHNNTRSPPYWNCPVPSVYRQTINDNWWCMRVLKGFPISQEEISKTTPCCYVLGAKGHSKMRVRGKDRKLCLGLWQCLVGLCVSKWHPHDTAQCFVTWCLMLLTSPVCGFKVVADTFKWHSI